MGFNDMNCEIIIYEKNRKTPRTVSRITNMDIYHMVVRDAFASGIFNRIEIRTIKNKPHCLILWLI